MPQRPNSNRGRSSSRSSGSDQPLMSQWTDTARDHPLTTAAAAAGAAAAGVFLWSRRNQISDQIGRLSHQISDFTEDFRTGSPRRELALTEGPNESRAIESSRTTPKRRSTAGAKGRGGRTAKARTTTGRAVPQSTTM